MKPAHVTIHRDRTDSRNAARRWVEATVRIGSKAYAVDTATVHDRGGSDAGVAVYRARVENGHRQVPRKTKARLENALFDFFFGAR